LTSILTASFGASLRWAADSARSPYMSTAHSLRLARLATHQKYLSGLGSESLLALTTKGFLPHRVWALIGPSDRQARSGLECPRFLTEWWNEFSTHSPLSSHYTKKPSQQLDIGAPMAGQKSARSAST
jgi:hypothetical protein